MGKAKSAKRGYKGGARALMRDVAKALREISSRSDLVQP